MPNTPATVEKPSYAARILEAAQRDNPAIESVRDIPPSQYRMYAIQVRTPADLIVDGAKALTARAQAKLQVRIVSLPVMQDNERICRENTCGEFDTLQDGSPVCLKCTCSSQDLRNKWKVSWGACPKKLWSNKGKATLLPTKEEERTLQPIEDRNTKS